MSTLPLPPPLPSSQARIPFPFSTQGLLLIINVLTIAGKTYSPDSASHYVISTQTLTPGSATIILKGTRYSLAPGGTALISSSSIIPLAPSAGITTISRTIYVANTASGYVIETQTLLPGVGPVLIISGTRHSLAASATALILGSSTIPLTQSPRTIIIDGTTYTANGASEYVIGSQTLRPGAAAITVSGGEEISLAVEGTNVVIAGGGRSTTESIGGLGGAVMSGFGAGPVTTTSAARRPFGSHLDLALRRIEHRVDE